MEESVIENISPQPRRRRSTFFDRRESIVPQSPTKIIDHGNAEEDIEHNQQLMSYYEKLLAEKNDWKNEVKSRRSKYHELRQQYLMAAESSSSSQPCFAALTNEDIEFLRQRVNFQKFRDSQKKLHQSCKVTKAIYGRACELDKVLYAIFKEKVNGVMDYLFEDSDSD